MLIDKPDILFTDYTEKTTPVSGDYLLLSDSAASNAVKKLNVGGIMSTNYTVTTYNVENTTAETLFATFTIPTGTWKKGDTILFTIVSKIKNSTGANHSVSSKIKDGASQIYNTNTPQTWTNYASEYYTVWTSRMFFIDTNVLLVTGTDTNSFYNSTGGSLDNGNFIGSGGNVISGGSSGFIAGNYYTITSPGNNLVMNFYLTLDTANANFYCRPTYAVARKY